MEKIKGATLRLISLLNQVEKSTPRLVGILVAREDKRSYNFSLFDVTENEIVLVLQIGTVIVYLAFESDENIDEDEYPELVEELLQVSVPAVKELAKAIKKENIKEPIILYDQMGPEVKEFLYDILLRHIRGKSPYDQTEAA